MTPVGSLFEFLSQARRRCISHLVLDRFVLALGAGCGAAIVILLAGSATLHWAWSLIAITAALIAGIFLLRRKLPTSYAVAQRVDKKLSLADTLSTAAYYSGSEEDSAPKTANAVLRDAQLHRAEDVARTVDLKQALPLERPRTLYPAAALALIAIGILLLRVAVFGTFDTNASLLGSLYKTMFGSTMQQSKTGEKEESAAETADGETAKQEQEKNADFAGDPGSDPSEMADARDKQQQGGADKEAAEQQASNSEEGEQGAQPDAKGGNDQSTQSQESAEGKQSQDPSMLDKLKEALSDMLNKMKPQSNQNSKNQKGQKGDQQQQAQQAQGQGNPDQGGDESDQQNNGRQSAEGEAQGDQAQGQKSEDAKSGVGDQEGDKALRDAQALKAMGKISELFGKRAENVSGSVMMEVGSTKQQLKTGVVQRNAAHAEAGSEIHRDEVPMMYEQFVQQYFEQIRKPAATKPVANAASAKK
ncbi:MAG: hypothetical protein ABL995_02610 [Bryobacteraceae bacterium]